MNARSRFKTFILCAAVVGAMPVAASAGHRHRCCRQRCAPEPACCAPAPTCCASAPACCAVPVPQPQCCCAAIAPSSGCCGQAGTVIYSNGQVAGGGTVYQYRSGYQGAVGSMTTSPVYQSGQYFYGTSTGALVVISPRPIMGQISANRHSLGKP